MTYFGLHKVVTVERIQPPEKHSPLLEIRRRKMEVIVGGYCQNLGNIWSNTRVQLKDIWAKLGLGLDSQVWSCCCR